MKYIDICREEEIVDRLQKHSGCNVAKIPLENINPKTSYWASSDGKSVYVLHLILDKFYIDKITIVKSGNRSKNSRPFFKVTTDKGHRVKVKLDSAVYGAFILKNRMPEKGKSIGLKEFDLDNCSVENLETDEDERIMMGKNAKRFARDYIINYIDMTKYCIRAFRVSKELAEDIVSEAFLYMLKTKTEGVINFRGYWVHNVKKLINYRKIWASRINELTPLVREKYDL